MVETARSPAVTQVLSSTPHPEPLPGDDALFPRSDATDLAAGLRLGADLLPAAYRPREVLLSDGQETNGDAVAAARSLHARGVEVDVVPLPAAGGPEALVETVTAPSVVNEGERLARAASGPTELVVFEEGNHVCFNISYKFRPLTADWTSERLNAIAH